MRTFVIAAVLALAASPALAAYPTLERAASVFLDAWPRGDKSALSALTARDGDLHMYGSDAAEFLAGRTLPIRFATVWRKEGGAWRLVQSSNVVPTTGQSAADLTR